MAVAHRVGRAPTRLPELDDALELRLRAGYEIDPLAGLRFDRLNAVRDQLAHAGGPASPDALMLAALILDACEDVPVEPVVVARRTVQRLDLGTPVEQSVASLVTDANLCRGGRHRRAERGVGPRARRPPRDERARPRPVSPDHGDLTRARSGSASASKALHDLIQDALTRPELTGRAAANEVEHRKAEARAATSSDAVRERIDDAPREYVLSQTAADLLRHAELCEPTPGRHDIRVTVEQVDDGYRVEVVARDRLGLIACDHARAARRAVQRTRGSR